ncbi:tRNA dihydrouridine synthase [Gilvimarinus algae]|uniref:tRNA-dihydrouridine(16) synthase n=1 Tax=Gilvimarinus algae TaxID=3058037 RepID=A0ABT8T8W1_9GAMM|nr:tRNA-dihydrouridine synthase [Gilvimarinus sp. SDUM040014]MDO3380564.1 tRNA-dihydrouridine synthase [Gilvimarinus sp. SDUM040014]
MQIHLAPMEGVVDYLVRDLLTQVGGIDQCVTEFVRVVDQRLPRRVFRRLCPELDNQCLTPAGVPVKVQLLGGQAEPLAENALRAVRAGATAIDLNFGCPAKTVNKSDGGACLLREPRRLFDIVSAVRRAVAPEIPVSAKIRLGYEDRSNYMDNARACEDAGANALVVHARSKADGYRPPAYWDCIGEIAAAVTMPVIANGEVWSVSDYLNCRRQSGCADVMLGRGLLACPDLARQIKAHMAGETYQPMHWQAVCELLYRYHSISLPSYPNKYAGNRVKQWLMYLRLQYPQAETFFEIIKREREPEAIERIFQHQLAQAA